MAVSTVMGVPQIMKVMNDHDLVLKHGDLGIPLFKTPPLHSVTSQYSNFILYYTTTIDDIDFRSKRSCGPQLGKKLTLEATISQINFQLATSTKYRFTNKWFECPWFSFRQGPDYLITS